MEKFKFVAQIRSLYFWTFEHFLMSTNPNTRCTDGYCEIWAEPLELDTFNPNRFI